MKIDLSKLKPIELSDKKFFDAAAFKMNTQSCECSFANLFMYRKPYGISCIKLGNRMVVCEQKARIIHYPMGEWTPPAELQKINAAFIEPVSPTAASMMSPKSFLTVTPTAITSLNLNTMKA